MKIIYLIPEGGYATELRSDTLWGMLCWGIRHLWGEAELEKFIERASLGRPDFIISSAFPYKQHGTERIPFFPNPLLIAPEPSEADVKKALPEARARKELKEVEWLNLDDFEQLLQGNLTSAHLLDRIRAIAEVKAEVQKDNDEYIPSGQTVRRTPPELKSHSQTHNTIDRLRGGTLNIEDNEGNPAGQLFHAPENYWHDPDNDITASQANTGLFFLADGPDLSKIAPVLQLFRHWGFGADRTSGKGFFNFEITDFNMPEPAPADANAWLNLSLFHPTREQLTELETANACLQYRLEKREGYVGGYRQRRQKQPRLYFSEGAVFARLPGHSGQHFGCIREQEFPDMPHKVWENGFAFMVNLNWK